MSFHFSYFRLDSKQTLQYSALISQLAAKARRHASNVANDAYILSRPAASSVNLPGPVIFAAASLASRVFLGVNAINAT